ncbi:MAG: metalloregulator ArsR/SmtB family transcription factor [Myxococcota bacterium]
MNGAPTTDDQLDRVFAALSDRTRRAMLARLAAGEATVTELGAPFAISQPAVTRHLQVLERAGLISRRRDAQRRPCKLEPEALRALAGWVGSYRAFWDESFDRLDQLLSTLVAASAADHEREVPDDDPEPR